MKFRLIALALTLLGTAAFLRAADDGGARAMLEGAKKMEVVDGDLQGAIRQYQAIADKYQTDRSVVADALVRLAECYQKLGDAQARTVYERLVRDFADQPSAVREAKSRLASIPMAGNQAAEQAVATRQMWEGIDVDDSGAISPDGRYLSFTDWTTGDLALRDVAAGTSRRLTNNGGWTVSGDYNQNSVFSADGRQIAYGWFVQGDFKNEIRVIASTAADSAKPRVLLRTDRNDYPIPFAWTPDGAAVLITRELPDHSNQIGRLSIQNGAYKNIKSLDWRSPSYHGISASPDGRYIAYDVPAGDAGSPRDIMLLAVDGSSENVVAPSAADDLAPQWSPDGTRLVFLSNRGGTYGVWTVPISAGKTTGAPTLAKADTGLIVPLGINRNGALYYRASGGPASRDIYVADVNTTSIGHPELATERFLNSNVGPAWSPDGTAIAYYSYRNTIANAPAAVIKSARSDTERVITLPATTFSPFSAGPKWFADGQSLLIVERDAQGFGFSFDRVRMDGSIERLHHITDYPSSYVVAPDGHSFYYAVQNHNDVPNTGRIARVDVETGRESVLKQDGWFISIALSPDGRDLAYVESVNAPPFDSTLNVVPVAGGPQRVIYRGGAWLGGTRYNSLAWTPDGRFVLFAQENSPSGATETMWRVPATGGERENAGLTWPGKIKSPSFSPDGRKIVLNRVDTASAEVWTLEHFLPASPRDAQQ